MRFVVRGDLYRRFRDRAPRNLVVFDGHCLMCHARIRFLIERNWFAEPENVLLYTTVEAREGQEVIRTFPQLRGLDSVLLVERIPSAQGRLHKRREALPQPSAGCEPVSDDLCLYTKSTAVFRMLSKSDGAMWRGLGTVLLAVVPHRLGDFAYDVVAKRRRLWGTTELDASQHNAHIMGLKERLWNGYQRSTTTRTSGPATATATPTPPPSKRR